MKPTIVTSMLVKDIRFPTSLEEVSDAMVSLLYIFTRVNRHFYPQADLESGQLTA